MSEVKGFKTIEKKYGVTVVQEESFWNPLRRKFQTTYKMYSADGCVWEKGLSRAGVKNEVETWGAELLAIKRNTNRR